MLRFLRLGCARILFHVKQQKLPIFALFLCLPAAAQEVWTFDRVDRIGNHPVTVVGHPRVVDGAVEFNGVDDALLVDVHPLAGAEVYTWESVFRPDGGNAQQRWFHLEENPATGDNADHRMLFEIRVVDGRWCLDAFNHSATGEKALLDRTRVHDLRRWYHVAAVYDGREFRSYVDGVLDGAAVVRFAPQGPGRAAVGMRLNRVYYFKGAVRWARFTRRALAPSEFLHVGEGK